MSHTFYCSNCGRWVADCGYSGDKHSATFRYSTTCACGTSVSVSCGGDAEESDSSDESAD
jgi:hypothetical protein